MEINTKAFRDAATAIDQAIDQQPDYPFSSLKIQIPDDNGFLWAPDDDSSLLRAFTDKYSATRHAGYGAREEIIAELNLTSSGLLQMAKMMKDTENINIEDIFRPLLKS
ncbi:hypothetical protein OG417_07025 [Actinoallomurus sp. NBC_01490]|uniref:hypothetical protein n=1 Tax=Actinoallomurus sp. NBC_01490 TaxID=2903557 RepID=UPI002E372913|nr:hypothetical protein [Actinoallomurus sp. NBC_01490]